MGKSINDILHDAHMSSNDTHYMFPMIRTEGYGDVTPEALERIYQGILENCGQKEAAGYTDMVAGLVLEAPDFNAPVFINVLQRLPQYDWSYDDNLLSYSMRFVYHEDTRNKMLAVPQDNNANLIKRAKFVQQFLKNHTQDLTKARRAALKLDN
jgi:hypothetical protein